MTQGTEPTDNAVDQPLSLENGVLVLENESIPVAQIKNAILARTEPDIMVLWCLGIITTVFAIVWLPAPIDNPAPGVIAGISGLFWFYKSQDRKPALWHLSITLGLFPKEIMKSEDEQLVRAAKRQIEGAISRD